MIHRDIKPENLILDQKGYLKITDLGVVKPWKKTGILDTSGTPGYMAPEVIFILQSLIIGFIQKTPFLSE
jgi:serine/threonine kinase 32